MASVFETSLLKT